MQCDDAHLAELEYLPVCGIDASEVGLGTRPVDDGCARLLGERHVTANEVRMKVGFEDVLQLDIVSLEPVEIGLYFAQGVDDGSFTTAGDVIGSLGQTAGVDLFDVHKWEA